jgi:cystathionine beta-lyase
VLLLCNPHNPTGHVCRREELVALAEVAAEHDRVMLADETPFPPSSTSRCTTP